MTTQRITNLDLIRTPDSNAAFVLRIASRFQVEGPAGTPGEFGWVFLADLCPTEAQKAALLEASGMLRIVREDEHDKMVRVELTRKGRYAARCIRRALRIRDEERVAVSS